MADFVAGDIGVPACDVARAGRCRVALRRRRAVGGLLAVALSIARRIWMVTAVLAVIVRSRGRCSDGSRTYRGSIVRAPMHSPMNPRNAARCERAPYTSVSFVEGDNDSP